MPGLFSWGSTPAKGQHQCSCRPNEYQASHPLLVVGLLGIHVADDRGQYVERLAWLNARARLRERNDSIDGVEMVHRCLPCGAPM